MIKRFVLLFCTIVFTFGYGIAQHASKGNSYAEVIAQNGYHKSSNTPPNSMEAFMSALQFGCDAATCEVQFTADEMIIIRQQSFQKIVKPSKLGASKGANGMPLEDFLAKYHRLMNPELAMKKNGAMSIQPKSQHNVMKIILVFDEMDAKLTPAMLHVLDKYLKTSEMLPYIELSSYSLPLCRALRQQFQNVPVTYLKGDLSPRELNKNVSNVGCAYTVKTLSANPNWVKDAHSRNMTVTVLDVTTESETNDAVSSGADRVLTDNVALVSAWIHDTPLVNLMSFNIRMSGMPKEDGDNAWNKRKEAVVRMFKEQNPDVFGVQEMLPDQQKYLCKELPTYKMVGVGRDDGRNEGECMGIFFKKDRFVLLDSGTFWLSQTPESPSMGWDAACKRTVTYVQLKDKQSTKKFYYFNTHLDHVGAIARQESVKLLAERIRKIVKDTNSVFILGGDMNCRLDTTIFMPLIGEQIQKHEAKPSKISLQKEPISKVSGNTIPMLKKGGRSRALMNSCRNTAWERDNMKTYNGFGKGTQTQIDHLLSSQKTENYIFKTIRNSYGVHYLSDHYPIMIVFGLK